MFLFIILFLDPYDPSVSRSENSNGGIVVTRYCTITYCQCPHARARARARFFNQRHSCATDACCFRRTQKKQLEGAKCSCKTPASVTPHYRVGFSEICVLLLS